MKTVAVYAGSFDPVTKGHLDILAKAVDVFDVVYCAVGNNPMKKHLFSLDQRIDMIASCSFPEIRVTSSLDRSFSFVEIRNVLTSFADCGRSQTMNMRFSLRRRTKHSTQRSTRFSSFPMRSIFTFRLLW